MVRLPVLDAGGDAPRALTDEGVSELVQIVGLLVRRVRAATANHELSLPEEAVLTRLENHGPATVAQLARAEGMRPQSMGPVVAGLTQAGLIERSPDPADRRQWMLSLTEKGAAARQAARAARREWLATAVSQLNPREQDLLMAATPLLRRLAGA